MLFWVAFIGCVIFAYVVGLVFGYHLRQNIKEGTPSASHNRQSMPLEEPTLNLQWYKRTWFGGYKKVDE